MTGFLERKLIEKVAEMARGNKTEMAKILGISRVTLQKKLGGAHESAPQRNIRKFPGATQVYSFYP
jgi:DNA-binding NtrC family response regulator